MIPEKRCLCFLNQNLNPVVHQITLEKLTYILVTNYDIGNNDKSPDMVIN